MTGATTKRRWDNLFRYILNDGSFPEAPIVLRLPEGLSPIDGTHWMAALSALSIDPGGNFRCKETSEARERTAGLDGQTKGR